MAEPKYNPEDFELVADASGSFNPSDFEVVDDEYGQTLNEAHPSFSIKDRLIVKNFGTNIDDSIAYLQKQHPELEVRQDSVEIIARGKGEKDFKKLDPSGVTGVGEFFQDVGDLGYDVLSGIGSTAATAAGGLAGSLPGAVAAGASSSAGLEALRQGLGKYFGVTDEISGGDIALSGALGAAAPALFGSGISAAQAAKQSLKEGGKRTAEEILKANKGYVTRALPKIGAFVSGVSEDILGTTYNKLPEIDALDEKGIKNFAGNVQKKVSNKVNDYIRDVGQEIGTVVESLDGTVDIDQAKTSLLELSKELGQEAADVGNDASKESFKDLQSLLGQFFSRTEKVIEDPGVDHLGFSLGDAVEKTTKTPIAQLTPKNALSLAQKLENYAKAYNIDPSKMKDRLSASAGVADKRISNAALEAARNIRSQLDELSGGALADLNGKYSDAKNLKDELANFIKDPRSTYRNLSNVLAPGNRILYETLSDVDKTLIDDAKMLAAYKQFSKAPWLAISAGGTTSTSRTVPISEAFGSLGYYAGAQSGMGQGGAGLGAAAGKIFGSTVGSPAMLRKYMQTGRNAKFLEDQARKMTGGLPAARSAIYSGWNALTKGGE